MASDYEERLFTNTFPADDAPDDPLHLRCIAPKSLSRGLELCGNLIGMASVPSHRSQILYCCWRCKKRAAYHQFKKKHGLNHKYYYKYYGHTQPRMRNLLRRKRKEKKKQEQLQNKKVDGEARRAGTITQKFWLTCSG